MLKRITALSLLCVAVLVMAAAATFSSSGCASVAPGNDPVIVNAERSEKIAFDTVNEFIQLEYANRADFQKLAPGVTAAADQIRAKAPALFKTIDAALDAYRAQKSQAGSQAIDNALAAVQAFVTTAEQYIAQWTAAKKTSSLLYFKPRSPEAIARTRIPRFEAA